MRLLLIEDEKSLSEALAFILMKNGYSVDVAFDGIRGQQMAENNIYDLLIVDRMLPFKEGICIIKELRIQGYDTPVLILTAKDAIKDRVEGLDAGADDYLVKPFSTEELLARIRALTRRQNGSIEGKNIRVASAVLKPLHKEVQIGNETVKLTLKETQLLELFFRNRKQVITREQILERVWGIDSDVEMNIIEIYIHNLRKKLKLEDCHFQIETIRGIGYCLKEVNHV